MSPRELADAMVEAGARAMALAEDEDYMEDCRLWDRRSRAAALAILRVLDPHMNEDWMMIEDVMEELGGKR